VAHKTSLHRSKQQPIIYQLFSLLPCHQTPISLLFHPEQLETVKEQLKLMSVIAEIHADQANEKKKKKDKKDLVAAQKLVKEAAKAMKFYCSILSLLQQALEPNQRIFFWPKLRKDGVNLRQHLVGMNRASLDWCPALLLGRE